MTGSTVPLVIQMTIPRLLADGFASPGEIKAYLCAQGLWPAGIVMDRWKAHPSVPGYLVDIEIMVSLPLPAPA